MIINSMNREAEMKVTDAYLSNIDIIGEGFPDAVNDARRDFIEQFNLAGLPDDRDERYRHTDIGELFGRDREMYFTPSEPGFAYGEEMPVPEGYLIGLTNGFCNEPRLERTAEGALYGSLHAAAAEHPELFMRHYNSIADHQDTSLTALNSAFMQDGVFIYVPAGISVERPIVIDANYASGEEGLLCFPRSLVVLEQGASAELIFAHRAWGATSFLADAVREVSLAEGAKLSIHELNRMNHGSVFLLQSYLRQQSGSQAESMMAELGNGTVRCEYTTSLDGKDAETKYWGLYMDAARERTDMNLTIRHQAPECRSYELVKGIASGEGKGAFRGLVYVAPDAQHTEALQQSRNLLLGDTARIFAEPQLEIYADDVKCSHGATVGQLDDEAVFYMRQRGLSEQEARALQMTGFVNDILGHCRCGNFCDYLKELAAEKIKNL